MVRESAPIENTPAEKPARQESQLKVDILEACTKLIAAFKSDRLPTRGQFTYLFPVALSPPMHMPQVLVNFGRVEQMDAVEITLTREDDEPTILGLTFVYPGKNQFTASIASNSEPESTTDLVLNPDQIDLAWADEHNPYAGTTSYQLSRKDINALLQSIIDPTKNGDYSHTAQFDFHDPEWLQGFVDTLATRAFKQRSVVTYSPDPEENLPQITYTEKDGNYRTVDVTIPTNTDDDYYHVRTDYQKGLTMTILGAARGIIDGELNEGEVYLDTDELERLHGLIANAYGRIKLPREESLGVLAQEQLKTIDPEKLVNLGAMARQQLESIDPERLV